MGRKALLHAWQQHCPCVLGGGPHRASKQYVLLSSVLWGFQTRAELGGGGQRQVVVTSTTGSCSLPWPKKPTQGCLILCWQNSHQKVEKPHCRRWAFPWGKGTNTLFSSRRPQQLPGAAGPQQLRTGLPGCNSIALSWEQVLLCVMGFTSE